MESLLVYGLIFWLDAILIIMIKYTHMDMAILIMYSILYIALKAIVFGCIWVPALVGMELVVMMYEWKHADKIWNFLKKTISIDDRE